MAARQRPGRNPTTGKPTFFDQKRRDDIHHLPEDPGEISPPSDDNLAPWERTRFGMDAPKLPALRRDTRGYNADKYVEAIEAAEDRSEERMSGERES